MKLLNGDNIREILAVRRELPQIILDAIIENNTVDAITVEFIEKKIAEYNDWNEDVEPLLKLLEDWRKANEESLAE